MKVQYLNFELVNADSLFLDVSASAVLLKSVRTNMSRLQTELCRSSILDGWWSHANSEPNAEVSGRARWIGYTLDFECPMSSRLQLLMSFPFSLCETPSGSLCQTLGWPMSTRAPRLESLCFPGYHLGFRKHSFMVAGLLPEGPIVINQSTSNTAHCASCRPAVLGWQVGWD